MWRLGLIPLLGLVPNLVFAAGGDMPSLVHDIGISLMVAGALAVIFNRAHIPSIAAFLLAGVIIGPIGLGLVTDAENIDTIAQLGFILLLFLIGLEIDFKRILSSGRAIIVSGLLQYPLTILFGMLAVKLMLMAGIGGALLQESPHAAIYIGVIIAGSSTLLVVKLFQEHFELDTEPGRLSLGMLIFQDIWVIVAIIIQPSLESPDFGLIAMSFLGIVLLALFTVVVALSFVGRAFTWIAKTPELTLTGALAWCFIVVFLGVNLDAILENLYGRNFHMSVGSGMAALIAGASIANLPSATEIITKVATVKDFFITLFFVALGISIPAPESFDVIVLAVAIAVIAILARQFIFFPLFYFCSVDQRNAQVASIRLAQISEFGLVIAFLGVKLGHLSPAFTSSVIFAFVITALATPLLYGKAYELHRVFQPVFEKLGFKAPPERELEQGAEYKLALLGFYRDASSLLYNLQQANPELVRETLVVDFNVALHERIQQTGAHVHYGDLSNTETLHHVGLDRARVIVCTIPDDLLRGITNRSLVRVVRNMCPDAIIIANAVSLDQVELIYAAGADWVYQSRLEAARALNEAIDEALAGRIDVFREKRTQINLSSEDRREVLD
ncbi:cation:proton antiporter [Elongatibacter sediminis]|uniref:Cation:proton antiporter n=1 Tax=Elongatibacter sediminis TaxID=3119006 RepID=A0AAW9RFS3_9GAMM